METENKTVNGWDEGSMNPPTGEETPEAKEEKGDGNEEFDVMQLSQQEASKKLMLSFVAMKITSAADISAKTQEIISSAPKALVEELRAKGASDNQIALTFFQAWKNATTGKPEDNKEEQPKNPTRKRSTKPTKTTMTAEDLARATDIMDMDATSRASKAQHSYIACALTERPPLSAIVATDATMIPVVKDNTEAKFAEWEGKLDDTPVNKQAFATIKAQVLSKQPMKIYFNTKARPKVIGFKLVTTDDSGTADTKIIDKEDALVFLICEVQGCVAPRTADGIGVKVRWRENNKPADATGDASNSGSAIVAIINQKNIYEKAGLVDCTSVVTEETTDTYRVKSAASFKVLTGKMTNGMPATRTVRVSGVTTAKVVVRKEEYAMKFGPIGGRKGGGMSKKEIQATTNAVKMAITALINNPNPGLTNAASREALARLKVKANSLGTSKREDIQ